MLEKSLKFSIICILLLCSELSVFSQSIIRGTLLDEKTGEPLIGATVIVKGTTMGTITDFEGVFILKSDLRLPQTLEFRYSGYGAKEFIYTESNKNVSIKLFEEAVVMDVVEVTGLRISDKQKESPLTVESMDLVAIKETPAANFYAGLGSLKDVDLTTASLGFTIINTRGFNSTNPVRSLQLIDGVDNQSPGLNFSLGNFLGASELDVLKVDLIVGASSAFYGPNAFNGVINMETKSPYYHKGLSASLKIGERNLIERSFRWADAVKNKKGNEYLAYKLNFFAFNASDWEADNQEPVYNSISSKNNPGGYDAVNTYGDEYQLEFDQRKAVVTYPGLEVFHRKGYKEKDIVDYNSNNFKVNGALHFRLQPKKLFESPELIFSSNYGGGTTVFQGDNRFSLKNIQFFQHRIELNKKDKYFLRFYGTHEDAGDSYDPYFTSIQLQQYASNNANWFTSYSNDWVLNYVPKIKNFEGYPKITDFLGRPDEYKRAISDFLAKHTDSLTVWHQNSQRVANTGNIFGTTKNFVEPGTPEFEKEFNNIISRIAYSEGGTRFFDRSALVHGQGEYQFKDIYSNNWLNSLDITAGASGRIYYPNSKGSILLDTGSANITTKEWGVYVGPTLNTMSNKLRFNITGRLDKNQNFDYLFSPAASVVYQPSKNNYLRVSFSSAIRNPTLTDQYLFYNVGRAILLGNINGINDLVTVESFINFLNSGNQDTLKRFNIPAIRPEKVRTFEIGYRTTLWNKLYADLGYYFRRYEDFIGYQLGVDASFMGILVSKAQVYRVSSNASDIVTSQGFSIGLNYFLNPNFVLKGNYSWNVLNTQSDDPIIPAFNTPEHKYNLGITGRDLEIFSLKNIGFSINYKWIEGFVFEGSPQFTGFIPSYNLTDAQINWFMAKSNITWKLGASNIFNQKSYQTYGGPLIGRMGYLGVLYEFKKN
ncbi:MAG: TonB-dependent receptor [Saprospiraceae bacterium]|nr:TonB-dependent receptor [Saprospiraceae bacterium]